VHGRVADARQALALLEQRALAPVVLAQLQLERVLVRFDDALRVAQREEALCEVLVASDLYSRWKTCGYGVVRLCGWLVGWLVGWLAGWLIGWLAGWLVDWLNGLHVCGWCAGAGRATRTGGSSEGGEGRSRRGRRYVSEPRVNMRTAL
jgi:hypothetical protein